MKATQTRLEKQDAVEALCRKFHVQSLDLFGSALRDEETARDYDFLVVFSASARGRLLKTYLDLADNLETVLGKPVELVTPRSLKNPIFRQEVLANRERIYEQQDA